MSNKNQKMGIIIGSVALALVLIIGLIFIVPEQSSKAIEAGSINLKVEDGDQEFLNSLQEVQDPQAADPSFGGSGVEQSPSYDIDTWKRLIND
ncbi:hypothetical protein KC644_02025 [Candidatus Berkelbacteria bacterium]|nr:hypothetical protein [Candidatus Berkelbacteria bacterium]